MEASGLVEDCIGDDSPVVLVASNAGIETVGEGGGSDY